MSRRKTELMKTAACLSIFILLLTLAIAQGAQSQPATDGHFTVAAGNFQDFPFAVEGGVKDIRLVGKFRATGGTASLIVVLVMNDDQYQKWIHHYYGPHASTPENGGAYYNSGETTVGSIDLKLPNRPANYHVVFNNTVYPYNKSMESNLEWEWIGSGQ